MAGNVSFNFVAFPFDEEPGFAVNIRPFHGGVTAAAAFTLLNFATMQWALYVTVAENVPVLLGSGTFHFGSPDPLAAGGEPSASGLLGFSASEQAADLAAAQPFDLTFDGFCDGLRIRIGENQMVSASHTGCRGGLGAGIVAFDFTYFPFDQQNGFGMNLGTFPDAAGTTLTILDFATQHWAHYRTAAGEVPVLVGSGTFRFGPPPASSGLPASG